MILITGTGGMVGSHLIEYLWDKSKVVGSFYNPTIDLSIISNNFNNLIECDVRYYKSVFEMVNKYRPQKIFHLAAQSYPTISWDRPQDTMEINVNGTINIFEAIKYIKENLDKAYDPIVVVACSSAEYGDSLINLVKPADETTALLPLHPYGVSKVAQDLVSYQYFKNFGIKCIRARIFNTTGPRKANDVCSDFTKRAIQIEKGLSKSNYLLVGNIETKRSITDVRDLVSALVLLSEKGKWGEAYNISGQKVYQIKEILDIIKGNLNVEFSVKVDESLLRPTDEKIIYGDSSKLIRDTGWTQKFTLEQTIKDMLDFWREYIC